MKRFFPNLNAIRGIAALMVLFHHIEQSKEALGIANIYHLSVMKHLGRLGVGLFFVLSGFLITYLLLQEKRNHGNIDARRFYMRRVFRIWPIYFLIVGLSYFVFPFVSLFEYPGANANVFNHHNERLFFLAIILPNYGFVLYDLPYWCAQVWSIGVEEQFYYLWPWIIKYPKRWLPTVCIFLLTTAALLCIGIWYRSSDIVDQMKMASTFIGQFRIQIMAVGGSYAYLAFTNKFNLLKIMFRKEIQIFMYSLTALLFFSGIHFSGFMEVYSLFFGYLILNLAANPISIFKINNRFINYTGKISYGLYLYHVAIMVFLLNILENFRVDLPHYVYNVILYISVIFASLLVSALSYEYLEKPLLHYKEEFFGRKADVAVSSDMV